MNIVGIIPARMGSSRFPGKPLAKINGLPMVEHVYHRTKMAKQLSAVYIATCDQEIKEAVEEFGGQVIMTSSSHERASDRVAEAMLKIEELENKKIDIVVMIQGDEPMVYPEMIDEAVAPILKDHHIQVTNLMAPLKTIEEQDDRNEIKVVVGQDNFALYFSREPIPTRSKSQEMTPMNKQVCIIPFQRDYLLTFNNLTPTPLEISESIDMLRILEHGGKVKMVPTSFDTYSVDAAEDLKKVEKYMQDDALFSTYNVLK